MLRISANKSGGMFGEVLPWVGPRGSGQTAKSQGTGRDLCERLNLAFTQGTNNGQRRMRWSDGIIDSKDMNLSKLWEKLEDRGSLSRRSPWGRRVGHDWTTWNQPCAVMGVESWARGTPAAVTQGEPRVWSPPGAAEQRYKRSAVLRAFRVIQPWAWLWASRGLSDKRESRILVMAQIAWLSDLEKVTWTLHSSISSLISEAK